MKNFHLLDICLPDYFTGHHLPVLAVPVNSETTWGELFEGLEDEANNYEPFFERYDEETVNQAINRLRNDNLHQLDKLVQPGLEDGEESIFSYWVLGSFKTDYLGFNYIEN